MTDAPLLPNEQDWLDKMVSDWISELTPHKEETE